MPVKKRGRESIPDNNHRLTSKALTSRVFEPKLKASVQEARLGERTVTCYG